MIERSDAPAIAALVAWPARRERPAYFAGSSPALRASFLTMRATSPPEGAEGRIWPCRVMERNTGPLATPACSIQAWTARSGHVSGFDPKGMPTFRPWASWSVLERRSVTVSPSRVKSKSPASSATSSERLNAPANPSRISARSRVPINPRSVDSSLTSLDTGT